jgi:uncharacterized membrane protein (DUF2068 family)
MKPGGSKAGLRTIAALEAVKGALVLFVAFGLPGLTHHHTRRFLEKLVGHFHLNPAHRYPQIFIRLGDHLDNTRFRVLAVAAIIYAGVRFAEAYGLWRQRRWGEWLGCVGAALYVPVEIRHLVHHPTVFTTIVLVVNLVVVIYLAACLRTGRKPAQPSPANSAA